MSEKEMQIQQRKQEEKRIREEEKQRKLRERYEEELHRLPQIDIKDFLIRKNVFKCMHSSHKIKDIVFWQS